MQRRHFVLLLPLTLLAVLAQAFPFWLEGPTGRNNPNDPKNPAYQAPAPTLVVAPFGSPTSTPTFAPPSATSSMSATFSLSPTPTPSLSATPPDTATSSATSTPSGTATPSASGTPSSTETFSEGPSSTPSPSASPSPSSTESSSASPSTTPSPSPSSSPSPTSTRTATPSASATRTATPSATATPTATPSPVLGPRGATVPWISYEAEDGGTNGTVLGPSRTQGQVAAESSGRRAVQLDATGEYLALTSTAAFNAVVVRYSIPDSAGGGGIDRTLSLYLNGVHAMDLSLTSRYSWDYGGWTYPYAQTPGSGSPVHMYEEARALLADQPAGTVLSLRKDAGDTASFYVIDLVDLEQVAPAAGPPANNYSILSYGAVANDAGDDSAAIQACINAAATDGRVVWMPAGTYVLDTALTVPAVSIVGAGLWHTTLVGTRTRFMLNGASFYFADFAILGQTSNRDDGVADNGFHGHAGTNSVMERVWVERMKCGWWVGSGNNGNPTDNLTIRQSRFRSLYADAVNFCNGTSNSVVEQCHARGTGDDAFASWSPSGDPVNTANVFRFNTVEAAWRANCYAFYGGANNRMEDNLCYDTYNYPGILIAQDFGSNPFSGTTVVERNSLIRAGGFMFGENQGALKLRALQANMAGAYSISDIDIQDATYEGLQLQGPFAINNATFNNLNISAPGTWGIRVMSSTPGSITINASTVSSPGAGGYFNGGSMSVHQGPGNVGW